jgi:hypothetical protein
MTREESWNRHQGANEPIYLNQTMQQTPTADQVLALSIRFLLDGLAIAMQGLPL